MGRNMVGAPISLLEHPDLTPSAKVVWLTLRLTPEAPNPARLAADTGLTLPTIHACLAQLTAAGWFAPGEFGATEAGSSDARVLIPAGLMTDPRLKSQAKLLYVALRTLPVIQDNSGEFTYRKLAAHAHIAIDTVKRAIRQLAETEWIRISQANQAAPVHFTLLDPVAMEAAQALRRLKMGKYRGEAIMREYLSLLIDSTDYEDNARPVFLVNPLTKERMELDRYYPPDLAFEFNGPQHYHTTERYPSEADLTMQQARDLMKEALCARSGIRMIVITRNDLNLQTMQRKVGNYVKLRDLRGHELRIARLESVSKSHRY